MSEPTFFTLQTQDGKPLPRRIRDMHAVYGVTQGRTCGHCVHLERYSQGTKWFKCGLSRKSSSVATDWRAGWPACGLFLEETA
jgi:hypothetical protein